MYIVVRHTLFMSKDRWCGIVTNLVEVFIFTVSKCVGCYVNVCEDEVRINSFNHVTFSAAPTILP